MCFLFRFHTLQITFWRDRGSRNGSTAGEKKRNKNNFHSEWKHFTDSEWWGLDTDTHSFCFPWLAYQEPDSSGTCFLYSKHYAGVFRQGGTKELKHPPLLSVHPFFFLFLFLLTTVIISIYFSEVLCPSPLLHITLIQRLWIKRREPDWMQWKSPLPHIVSSYLPVKKQMLKVAFKCFVWVF